MPNPRAQQQLAQVSPNPLDRAVHEMKSLAQPAQALGDMLASTLRGSVAATAGAPGDIRELVDLFGPEAVERVLGKRVMPTTDEMKAMMPKATEQPHPYESLGEFLPLPGVGKVAKAVGYGAGRGAGALTRAIGEGASERLLSGQGMIPGLPGQVAPAMFAAPPRLPRAPAKSKEEIRSVAERMAPQLTGEFVRGEKGTQSVAGKTQKQFAREKELKHDIRSTDVEHPSPEKLDYEKLKGNVVMGIAGDPTITGKTVEAVAGSPLRSGAPQHGGPLYGLGRDDSHFWASNLGAARGVQNRVREIGEQYDQPVLGQYVMMGPESINYAQHFADANLNAIDPARMRKSDIEGFNKLIRHGSDKSGPRPSFPGIENPEEAYLQMAVDPELRKHFNALMQMPTVTEKFNLPSGIDVRHAITEPELRDLETGVTGYSVGQMRPDIQDLKLSEHPTYSHDIPGHFMGQSKYPIPYQLMFPDTVEAIRANPKQAPHEFGSLKMIGPRQTIDQQMIDEIKQYEEMMKSLTGKAEGGSVGQLSQAALEHLAKLRELRKEFQPKADAWTAKQAEDANKYTQDIKPIGKAAGGGITAEDLEIEERPL